MALMRRPASVARGGPDELAELWVRGMTAPHSVNCGCGGMAMPQFDPTGIERDLLDYLLGKYGDAAPEGVADFLRARRDHPGAQRFENWLARLNDAPLADGSRERLTADLRLFLESFAEQARPRVGVCY